MSRIELLNFLGVVGGGLFPVFVVIGAHVAEPLTTPGMFKAYLAAAVVFGVVCVSCIFVATVKEQENQSKKVERALVTSAVISVLCLTAFVLTTGGPFASPFSFHYLYIPVVTGLCLGRNALKTACIGCGLLFLICALVDRLWLAKMPWNVTANNLMLNSSSYFIAYIFIFYLQLAITYLMAKETVLAEEPTIQEPSHSPN